MAAYRRKDDLRSPAGCTLHRDQLRAQRSVSTMGSLYLYLFHIPVSTGRVHGPWTRRKLTELVHVVVAIRKGVSRLRSECVDVTPFRKKN